MKTPDENPIRYNKTSTRAMTIDPEKQRPKFFSIFPPGKNSMCPVNCKLNKILTQLAAIECQANCVPQPYYEKL